MEGNQPAAGGTGQQQQQTAPPPSLLGQDLAFAPNWRESLPEDIRAEPSLGTVRDLPGLVKQYVSAQKMIGRDKVVLPGEHATEAEVRAFYQRLGVPEDPKGYKFDAPQLPEGVALNEKLDGWFREAAHKHGLTPKQASALYAEFNGLQAGEFGERQQAEQATIAEAEAALKKEWGKAFDSKLELAKRAVTTFGAQEAIDKLGLGNHPDFVRMMARVGEAISEDKLVKAGSAMTPVDAQSQINAIMGDPKHPYHQPGHPQHGEFVEKVSKLFQFAYPQEREG
jgi:hypothetical protein